MRNLILILLSVVITVSCQQNMSRKTNSSLPKGITPRPKTPLMGWASWNSFRVNINEKLIMEQADAMVTKGLKDAGYRYVNIDDGFFGGRNQKGELMAHPERFPNGMKALADYIHSKGLKAGIYSDAGINTCASFWDKDTIGVGMGLWGHDEQDLMLMLINWQYDFIKVDWCGGEWLGLDEQTRYTQIGELIREIRPDVVYNVCRWQFPGEWVCNVADSWRISGDIGNNYRSVMHIIDMNANLWKYSSPGHVNDMDMLQVGRGMSRDENKTHFSMWCMMNSPLMIGDDLRDISDETVEILTNRELIAINQDPLGYQARRVIDNGELEVWAKPLISTMSGKVAVALINRSVSNKMVTFNLDSVGLIADKGYVMRDLWNKKDYKISNSNRQSFNVPSHGIVVLRLEGTAKPFNLFQFD